MRNAPPRQVSNAGVSAGIDGSLRLAEMLKGKELAERIQLEMQYAPEPPFTAGSPSVAPAPVFNAAKNAAGELSAARLQAAGRVARRLQKA